MKQYFDHFMERVHSVIAKTNLEIFQNSAQCIV